MSNRVTNRRGALIALVITTSLLMAIALLVQQNGARVLFDGPRAPVRGRDLSLALIALLLFATWCWSITVLLRKRR